MASAETLPIDVDCVVNVALPGLLAGETACVPPELPLPHAASTAASAVAAAPYAARRVT